jgi:putative hydrolase of the HAD superfamily
MMNISKYIPGSASIKNIIFDFGGVICNLDVSLSVEKFKEFGHLKPEYQGTKEEQDRRFEKLVANYETGLLTTPEFRNVLRNYYQIPPTDTAIDDAWNILLLGIPEPRVRLLEDIRNHYRIFLLSNSNEIHYRKFGQDFKDQHQGRELDSLFEKTYFSFLLNLRKPDLAIFSHVLMDKNLHPSETLFIDDTLTNITAARESGMAAYLLSEREDITQLFEKP